MFTDIINNDLNMNLRVNKAFRVGKRSEDRPRLLVMTMDSEAMKWDLLKHSTALRNSNDEVAANIFVNPDLTAEEREIQWKLRQECRDRKANGERVKIVTGKVVTVREDRLPTRKGLQ